MAPSLFSRMRRRAFSMRARRSSSVMASIAAIIGFSFWMASGTDWPLAICARPAAAVVRKVRRRMSWLREKRRVLFMPLGGLLVRQRHAQRRSLIVDLAEEADGPRNLVEVAAFHDHLWIASEVRRGQQAVVG